MRCTALQVGRRVLALDFDGEARLGNRMLLERGAVALRERRDLFDQIAKLADETRVELTELT